VSVECRTAETVGNGPGPEPLSLDAWGKKVSPERADKALENLEKDGRLLQIPHETWCRNSGCVCFYGYHKAYGTGYALLTLARCR
jgi:hypothetical protein